MNKQTIIINGDNLSNLETFYEEVDRALTKDLGWPTGRNLDAFNDVLSGGFGVFEPGEPIILIWKNSSKSKIDLGLEETKKYYENKIISKPESSKTFKTLLDDLITHKGQTLFEIIMEIISEHQNIEFKTEN